MNLELDWEILKKVLTPIVIVVFCALVGFVIDRRLKKFRTNLNPDTFLGKYSSLLASFEGSIFTLSILGGIALVLPMIGLPNSINTLAEKVLIVVSLTIVTLITSKLAVKSIQLYSLQNSTTVSLTSLFEYLTKLLIFTIGFLIIIQSIGIQITALITAFGVGSLSIGLAFQNTLSNLISGVNIIISRKIQPGDYIELKDGEQGYVMDVELKYTLIKDIYNNVIVIPNSNVVDASFKNYTLDKADMLLPIKIGVSYDSNLEQVEQVTLNTAKDILTEFSQDKESPTEKESEEIQELEDFEPFLRYEKFDYYAITFSVYLKIYDYYDRLLLTHNFIKAIHQNYSQENIELAYPLPDNLMALKDATGNKIQ